MTKNKSNPGSSSKLTRPEGVPGANYEQEMVKEMADTPERSPPPSPTTAYKLYKELRHKVNLLERAAEKQPFDVDDQQEHHQQLIKLQSNVENSRNLLSKLGGDLKALEGCVQDNNNRVASGMRHHASRLDIQQAAITNPTLLQQIAQQQQQLLEQQSQLLTKRKRSPYPSSSEEEGAVSPTRAASPTKEELKEQLAAAKNKVG